MTHIIGYPPTVHPHFFLHNTAATELYTLSLHDALPISFNNAPVRPTVNVDTLLAQPGGKDPVTGDSVVVDTRSEEHTSELQSLTNLVCRLLLEKKKTQSKSIQLKQISTPCIQKHRLTTT